MSWAIYETELPLILKEEGEMEDSENATLESFIWNPTATNS